MIYSSMHIKTKRLFIQIVTYLLFILSPLSLFAQDSHAQDQQNRSEAIHFLILAEIAWNRNLSTEALQYYLHALKIYPDKETAARATEMALVASQFEPALFAATKWAQLDPKNQHAQAVVMTLLIKSSQVKEALPFMQALYEINHDKFAQAMIMITSQMRTTDERSALFELAQAFYKSTPKNINGQFVYALAASRNNKIDLALKQLKNVLKEKPDWTQAIVLYVKLLQKNQQYEEAISYLKRSSQHFGQNSQLQLLSAKLLIATKQYQAAKIEYKKLVNDPLFRNDALTHLAIIAIEQNQMDMAQEYLVQLLTYDPANSAGYFYLGYIEELNNNYTQAMQYYEKVGLSNYFYSAQINLAVLTARVGNLAESLSRIHSLMLNFPDKQKQLTVAGAHILLEANESDNAYALISEALGNDPNDIELLYTRGVISAYQNNIEQSEVDLGKVIKMQPNHSSALNVLGFILADNTNRYDEAYAYIDRAFKLEPNNPIILDSMGWILYRLGKYKEAVKHLQKAYQLDPDGEIAAHLGEVLWVSGKPKEAKAVFRDALKRNPDLEILTEVMQRLKINL